MPELSECEQLVDNRCPLSLQIDWWEIPPYIYKDPEQTGGVIGIFPDILKKLVQECCDPVDKSGKPKQCVNLNFTEVPSNDSEVVKKHIGMNGIARYFCFNVFISFNRLPRIIC